MSSNRLTEAQRTAKRERDRRYRERKRAAAKRATRNQAKPTKPNRAKPVKTEDKRLPVKVGHPSPMQMIVHGLTIITAALSIAASRNK